MTAAFVETTTLTDFLLKKDGSQQRAAEAFARHATQVVPQFAWKEFKRGPLKNFVWAHNKLFDTKSFLAFTVALQRMLRSPHRYLTSTAIQAIHTGFAALFTNMQAMQAIYQGKADPDQMMADAFRLELKLVITRAWKDRAKLFGGPAQKLSCYPDAPLGVQNGLLVVAPRDCPKDVECCLQRPLVARRGDLRTVRTALKSHTDRKEIAVRGKIIRQLEKHPSSVMGPVECRGFGDAYFVLFCPKDGVIITTNVRDIEPMANALGVAFEAP